MPLRSSFASSLNLNSINMKHFFKHGPMLTALFFAAIIFLASCKDDRIPDPVSTGKRLEKISQQDEYMSFQYNADGTLKQAEVKDDAASGGGITTYQFAYDGQKRMTLVTTSEGEKMIPAYTGTKLTSVEVKDNNNQSMARSEYTYQGEQLVAALVKAKIGPAMIDILKFTFTYNNAGNNIRTTVFFPDMVNGGMVENSHIEFEYDNKQNPLKDVREFLMLVWQVPSNNNIAREVHTDEDNAVEETVEYTYTYNTLNFPQSAAVKRMVPGMPVENMQLQVTYK